MSECIIITLVIKDEETVDNYKDSHPDYIFEDLKAGTLLNECELVSMTVAEQPTVE